MQKKAKFDIITDGGALVSTGNEKSSWHAEDIGWPLKKSDKNILVITTRKEEEPSECEHIELNFVDAKHEEARHAA